MVNKKDWANAYFLDRCVSPFARKYFKWLDEYFIEKRKIQFNSPYLNVDETHNLISNAIENDDSFMLGRLGNTERHILAEFNLKKLGLRRSYSKKWLNWLLTTSGFFVNDQKYEEQVDKLAELFLQAMGQSDLEGLWDYDFEALLINEYAKNAKVTNVNNTLIYSNLKNSWGKRLNGKKVLFVAPFEKTIQYQYSRIKQIWGDYDLLGDFELITYKSPYTAAGNNPQNCSWFDIFNKMVIDIEHMNFDVAILGCGVYGYPLASEIKKMGKVALQMCGETQIIMGILGKRWDDGGYVNQFKNEFWIHPIDEKPSNFEKIEGGCYW